MPLLQGMRQPPGMRRARRAWARWPVALAFAIPLLVFWLQRDIGLSLLDEGFVWYGAQRVLHGEVPLRDFQAYDIGRYGWYAAWMWLMDSDGIVPLRAASAVLAGCTVAIVMLLLQRNGQGLKQPQRQPQPQPQPQPQWQPQLKPQPQLQPPAARQASAPVLALAAATFALWMVPYFKVADSFAALLLLAGLAGLLAMPGASSWLRYGVCLGVAGTIGINHAFYGVLAAALLLAWARWHGLAVIDARRLAAALAGVAIGYAPVIACHLWVPGFTAAFVDTIRILWESGTTNLGRPLGSFVTAWSAPGLAPLTVLREFTLSAVLLVLAPAFGLVCVWQVLRRGQRGGVTSNHHPLFTASVIASVAYAHYAISRADITHLSVSVLPLLVAAWTFPWASASAPREPARHRAANGRASAGCLPLRPRSAGLPTLARALFLPAVFVISGVVAAPEHGLYPRLRGVPLQPVAVADEVLRLPAVDARDLRFLQALRDAHAQPPRALYVVPYWPGAYAALRMRAPVWEIYALFPATAARQRREIQRLRQSGVNAALLQRVRMDDRADLGFAQTHPLITAYLANCMAPLPVLPLDWHAPRDFTVFVGDPLKPLSICALP